MKDWIFPSCAFLVFIYGMFFIGFYVYKYTNSEVNVFSDSKANTIQYDDISNFLQEISKSFK